MNIVELLNIINLCEFYDYKFYPAVDGRGAWFVQGEYFEADTVTGKKAKLLTRRFFLSPAMTKSEVVQTVFKCAMTSMEHRTREWFKYRGKPVFGPHFDVDALYKLCTDGEYDRREERNLGPLLPPSQGNASPGEHEVHAQPNVLEGKV